MRTIGTRLPPTKQRGDVRVLCVDCGVQWHRSDCVRGEDGRWRCPDDAEGMDPVQTARSDADAVLGREDAVFLPDPGNIDGRVDI